MKVEKIEMIDKYYKALVEKDESFVGVFYAGVKTTGIFCISNCTARKPKKENVEFFTEMKEPLQHGYRPCKICKPTENANHPPEDVQQAIDMVKANPMEKIKDYHLRENQLSPEKIRRWFKKHYGITFQAYQRMLRINSAYRSLQNTNNKVSNTAFDTGYESLSGFGYTFKKLTGVSPADADKKSVILIERITTPIGPMFVCATEKGVCLLEFTDRRMLETEFTDLQKRLNAVILLGENEHTKQLKKELKEYFEGKRTEFDVALDTPGTEFQNEVWKMLREIPYAKTRSYQEQAEKIGNPKAVRAVAAANGQNKIAILFHVTELSGKTAI